MRIGHGLDDGSRACVRGCIGAEIGVANLRSALTGSPLADMSAIWKRWDALPPAIMIRDFAAADGQYLDALDQLDLSRAGDLNVPMNAQQVFPLDVTLVMRLAEHALHNWDIRVSFDAGAEVDSDAADLLVDLYPRDVIGMMTSMQVAGRIGRAALRIDIDRPPRALLMTFGDAVTLENIDATSEGAPSGRLRLPVAGPWVRLLTGRLDIEHTPRGVECDGTPTLAALRSLLQGDPMASSQPEVSD